MERQSGSKNNQDPKGRCGLDEVSPERDTVKITICQMLLDIMMACKLYIRGLVARTKYLCYKKTPDSTEGKNHTAKCRWGGPKLDCACWNGRASSLLIVGVPKVSTDFSLIGDRIEYCLVQFTFVMRGNQPYLGGGAYLYRPAS